MSDATYTAEQTTAPSTDAGKEVSRWMDRITIAKKSHEQWESESGAKRFIDEYNGKFDLFFNGLKGKIPVPPINEVFAYVQADIAVMNNRDPYLSVNPRTGTVEGAKLWEVAINQEWRHLRTKEETDLEIIDKDLVGFGWHKVGMNIESEGDGDDLHITSQELYSMRVDWRDVLWNIGAKRPPKDCVWMAQRIVKPLEWVKKKYPNAATIEGVNHPEVDEVSLRNALYKDDIKVVVMWEVWDSESKQIYLLAEGLKEKYLQDPKPWPPYLDEFPFLMYWDYLSAGKSRPMSAIAPWESQILEKMVILASAVNHVKRWNRQMIVKQGTISDESLDQFERGDDGAIINNTGSGDLAANVKLLDFGQLPTDFYLILDRLSQIENNVNGQPEIDRGGVTKTNTRTIGELELIKQGAKGRTDRKIDRFETHQENIARHMMAHMKANYDLPTLMTVTGDTPEEVIQALGHNYDPITRSVTFTPAEIEGEYDVEVKAGSTLPLNRETKLQILENVLQTLGNISPNGPSPLLTAVITEMLEAFDMKRLTDAYKEEQQAMQQQQQAEAQTAQAGQIKDRAQAAKNVAQTDKLTAEADIMREQHVMNQLIPPQPAEPVGARP